MGIRKIQPVARPLRPLGRARVTFEEREFLAHHGSSPFRVEHDLSDHPLFELERLAQLADRLPAHRVEWNAADLPLSVAPGETPSNGLSIAETLQQIHCCGSWIVLKHVQLDPEYAGLLEDCLARVEPVLAQQGLTMSRPVGFIFVSSPGATTPCHLDPESNFLLQIRGSKTVSTLPRHDARFVDMKQLETFTAGGDRHVKLNEEVLAEAVAHELHPGDGVHVPLHAPHFVKNGPAVSISFSITFQTEATDIERGVLWMNHRLRALGLAPRAPGVSRRADLAKVTLFKGLRAVRRLLRNAPLFSDRRASAEPQ